MFWNNISKCIRIYQYIYAFHNKALAEENVWDNLVILVNN